MRAADLAAYRHDLDEDQEGPEYYDSLVRSDDLADVMDRKTRRTVTPEVDWVVEALRDVARRAARRTVR